jgi:hypothetical protein
VSHISPVVLHAVDSLEEGFNSRLTPIHERQLATPWRFCFLPNCTSKEGDVRRASPQRSGRPDPTLKGRILISFSRPSLERPSKGAVVKVPGDLHVLHLLKALHVLLLLGDVPLVFNVQLRLPDPLLGLVLTDLGRIDIRSGLEYPPPGP